MRDIDAAHAEGLDFGAVGWGYTKPEALRARTPKLMFGSINDMAAQLAAMCMDRRQAVGRR